MEFINPPKDVFGNTLSVVQCITEVKRRDGVYGFKGCRRRATQVFHYSMLGHNWTMHYCSRHAHIGQKKEKDNPASYNRDLAR